MQVRNALRLLAPLLFMALAACLCLCGSAAFATTYYVDSAGGNDEWNGTSPATAWQNLTKVNTVTFSPADEILLKAGSVWNGQQLYPKGSGTSGSPIVVDMYDTGVKPIINGAGAYQEAVHLYNQEYWELNNLEVTNYDPAGPAIRQGIRVLGEDCGTLNHIHLVDLEVHNVNGHMTEGGDKGKCNAGILVEIAGEATPSKFDDVLVEGCYIHDVSRTALKIWSSWGSWCENPTVVLHSNIVVRNNYVDYYAGDGICPFMSDGALVEYNISSRGCYELEGNLANAPLWAWDMANGVFQYNEVYDTIQTRDGMGFDVDGCCQNNVVQYNYFHDNNGGLLMIIGTPDCANKNYNPVRDPFCNDNIFRYNISQRDLTRVLRFVGKIWDNYVYNNTIYVGPDVDYTVESGKCGDIGPRKQAPLNTYLYNNIIYNVEDSGARYQFVGDNYVWDYNVFYGHHPAGEPSDPHKITDDPLLVSPGSGGLGIDSVDGYKLQSGSPCRDSGMAVPDCGGQDYWGNTVPSGTGTDRGAHEYQAGPQPPVADFSGTPRSGPAPLTVYFTDLSLNDPTSWDWTFGDGGASQAQHPSHEYTSDNTYTVSLTAANAQGQDTETKPDYITVSSVGEPPVADFSGSPQSGPAPLTVNFTDLSSNGPTSWDWTFGDGGTSQVQDPSHEYTSEDTYTVSLTVANAYGEDTETKPDYITVTSVGGDYVCVSLTIEVGTLVSGDHNDTHASDDVRVVIDSVKATGKQSVYNIYTFETGLSSLSSLTVTNESQYSNLGSTGYQYRYIELWDWSAGEWVWIERPRIYTAGEDVTTVTNVPSPSTYLSGTGQVQVRFRHGCVNSAPWTLSVDHVKITAQP